MKDDGEIIIICMRLSKDHPVGYTLGIQAACRNCQADVWLSDTSMQALREQLPEIDFNNKIPVVKCIECSVKIKKDLNFLPPAKVQISEMVKLLYQRYKKD